MLVVVPGRFPILTLSPVNALMVVLLPELGLPVNMTYLSDISTTNRVYALKKGGV